MAQLSDQVANILRTVAQSVVMPRFMALEPGDIELKSPNEPVTVADREAEVQISTALADILPGSRVIGEEASSANPALLARLGEGTVWIVDPIDGTANFVAGHAPFAMMIALMRKGELVGSWIFDPLSDRLFMAELGGGAWIDGHRLCSKPSSSDPSKWHAIISRAFATEGHHRLIDSLSASVGWVDPTARCAGHEYPLVATGERDFALYWRTLVWDHAPGALLLSEAGGCVMHLDGARYDPLVARSGLILAHDAAVAETLLTQTRFY